MHVLSIGASKNIGYHAAIRLLGYGATVTFMLRSPAVFDNDQIIQDYLKKGLVRIIKGDALVRDDVKRAWEAAAQGAPGGVDYLVFTVGGTPHFELSKGFVIDPANLVTQSLLNAVSTIPPSQPSPKIITISSTGLNPTSHKALPFPIRLMYSYLLVVPHKDKVGAERVVAHCAGWPWNPEADGDPDDDIMGSGWKDREGMPQAGSLKNNVVVIRPALLTDGDCKADKEFEISKRKEKEGKAYIAKEGYRVKEGDLSNGWTVARKDVAHFLVEGVINHWEKYQGKCLSIAY